MTLFFSAISPPFSFFACRSAWAVGSDSSPAAWCCTLHGYNARQNCTHAHRPRYLRYVFGYRYGCPIAQCIHPLECSTAPERKQDGCDFPRFSAVPVVATARAGYLGDERWAPKFLRRFSVVLPRGDLRNAYPGGNRVIFLVASRSPLFG